MNDPTEVPDPVHLAPDDTTTCPFCEIIKTRQNYTGLSEHFVAIPDSYPVSRGHTLIIPREHIRTTFDISPEHGSELFDMIHHVKSLLDQRHGPDGYNIGFNCGEAAGQRIMHAHVHIIPRYKGDHPEPGGGSIRDVLDPDWIAHLKRTREQTRFTGDYRLAGYSLIYRDDTLIAVRWLNNTEAPTQNSYLMEWIRKDTGKEWHLLLESKRKDSEYSMRMDVREGPPLPLNQNG